MAEIHILAFPFPIPGHINCLMYFCKRLLASVPGFSITFASNEESYSMCLRTRDLVASKSAAEAAAKLDLEHKLAVVSLPDGLEPVAATKGKPHPSQNLERPALSAVGMRPALEELIRKFELEGRPVACILTDTFNGWVQDTANKFDIPKAAFWTSNAINEIIHLFLPQLVEQGFVPAAACKPGRLVDILPGLPPMPATDLPLSFYYEHPILDTVADGGRRYREAEFGLCNTVEELEPHAVSVMRTIKSKHYCIGPCLSPDFFVDEHELDSKSKALGPEDIRCLEWLDKQEKTSVIYVSFGSVATMSVKQAEEFALGLEQAGHPFLLVLRKTLFNSSSSELDEFIQRIGDRGLVVSWAPQMHILLHPSTGGFLTHCGWNSTLEAICAGVPMLAWPCMAEQNVNCRELVNNWKIALEVKDDEFVGGAVSAKAVAGLVERLMDGEEGQEMRVRAQKMRELARSALRPNGSSDIGLREFARAVQERTLT